MPTKTYSPGQFQVPPEKAADGMLRDHVDDTLSPAPAHLPGNSVAENILLPINYDNRYGKLPWDNDPKIEAQMRFFIPGIVDSCCRKYHVWEQVF